MRDCVLISFFVGMNNEFSVKRTFIHSCRHAYTFKIILHLNGKTIMVYTVCTKYKYTCRNNHTYNTWSVESCGLYICNTDVNT